MRATIRAISVFLAGAMPTGVLVGLIAGGAQEAKATLGPLQAVTVSAADFHPIADDANFIIDAGTALHSDSVHIARVPFPAETVVITTVKARVYDNAFAEGDLCVAVLRNIPAEGAAQSLGQECTDGAISPDPQTMSVAVFTRIGRFHTAGLSVAFDGVSPDLRFYGATVFYRVVS